MNFRFFKRLYSSLLIFLLTLQIFLPVIKAETIDSVNSTDDSGINLVSASYNDQKKAVQLSLKVMNSANTNFDSNITISTNNNSDLAVLDSQKLVSTSGKVIGNFKIESNKIRLQINPEVTSENAIIDVPISESQNINMMSFAWQSQTVKAEIASQNSDQSTSSSSSMNSNTSTSNTTVSNIKERSAAVSIDETGNDISQYLPESSKGTIIDSAKISFTDQSGNNVAATDVNAATNINFSFDWSVPNELKDGYSLKGGDYFEFKLPSNVTYTAHSGSLGDYGSFTVSSDGTVRLTFNDNVNDESDVGGTFNYNGNKINVDNPGETTIDVPTTDGSVSVPVTVNTTGGQAISKSGTLDKQTDSDAVTWQVDVNTSRDELKSAQVKENMPDSVSLDSTDVYLLNVGLDGNPTGEGQKLVEGTDYELDSTTGDIQFIGKYADTTQSFRIIYHTTIKESSKPTNGGNLNITNSADLINGDKTSNAKATVDPSYNSVIKKSGYQSGPGKASWTIDYNLSNETLSASQATITDTLDSNSEYDQDSVKVVDANYQTLTEGKDYTLSFDSNSNQMKIEFPNGLSTGVHVTYDTKYQGIIPDNNNQPGSVDVTNNASGNGDNTSASTTINAKGVDKSYSDVDYTNKKLKWTIEFNQDQQYLKDATITDTLGKGLTLLDGDDNFQVIDENTNQVLPADYYTMTSTSADGSNPGQFEVTLNDKLPESQRSDTYKIVYWTSFDYSQMSNSNFDNSVNYTWTDNNGDKHQSSKDTPFYPTQNVINDGTKSGYYNATNKNIYWTVGVNYRGNNLKDAIISDMIQAGQNYVSGSAELYEVTGIDGNGNAQTSSEPVMDQDIVYENGLLTAKLPTGNKTYVLKYQTSLAGTMIQKSYDNTATFTNDGQTEDYQATVSVNEGGDELEKSGSQSTTDSSYVNWTLTLNAAQSTIANASITDTPSANSSVDISTIKIQKAAVNQDGWIWQDTSQPYLQEGTDYKVSQNDDGSFTITFLKTIDAAYYVTYDSLIDSDKATDEVTNTASLSGNGQESISGDVSSSTWVTNSSGSSHASNYEIKLLKVDDTTGSALSGAEFTLTKKNSSSFNENGTTNENGELDFSNLKAGTYYVEETKAPAGYVESDKITQITLDKEHSQDGILTEKITNTEKTGSVVLTKTDADTGKALSQAVFSLYDKAGNKIKDNVTTGTDGKVTVDGLKPGEYYFKETSAPAGYEYDADKEYNFTVDLQTTAKVATVSVTDTEKTGSVVLTKTDADTGKALSQAVFSLYDKAGNKIKDNVTTGTDGKVTVDGLKPGEYYFKETSAPAGYEYDADKEYNFTVDLQTTAKVATVSVTDTEKTGSVVLTKTDADTGKALSQAVFSLYDKAGNKIKDNVTTGTDGKVTVDGLKPGEYYFKETSAPAGYEYDADKEYNFTVDLQTTAKVATVSVTDTEKTGSVVLTKTDADTGKALSQAVFSLFDKAGNKIKDNVTTGTDGKVTVDGLKPGEYYFKETSAPAGYEYDADKEYNFTVDLQTTAKVATVSVTDTEKTGSVVLTKTDADTGKALSQAVFSLYDKAGNKIKDNVTTGTDGKVTVDGLKPGEYYFKETSAPAGYEYDADKEYNFTVDLQTTAKVATVSVTDTEKTGSVVLTKTDADTGKALSQAVFSLFDKAGNKIKDNVTTGTDGKVTVDGLKPGEYYFKETSAPAGYEYDADKEYSFTVDLQTTAKVATVGVTDTEKTGSVVLTKTDADTGKALSQAVFSLYDKAGNKIKDNVTTGTDGKVTVDGLKPGEYYFKETSAPAGYEYDADKEYSFTVDLQTTAKVATVGVTDKSISETKKPSVKQDTQNHNISGKHNKVRNQLPQTGQKDDGEVLGIFGAILVMLAIVLMIVFTKREKSEK